MSVVAERVAAGVAWLDEHGPTDWPWRVRLNDLDMSDSCGCVLGWVFADEAEASDDCGSGWEWAGCNLLSNFDDPDDDPDGRCVALGFDRSPLGDGDPVDYGDLHAEWTATILRLRSERGRGQSGARVPGAAMKAARVPGAHRHPFLVHRHGGWHFPRGRLSRGWHCHVWVLHEHDDPAWLSARARRRSDVTPEVRRLLVVLIIGAFVGSVWRP